MSCGDTKLDRSELKRRARVFRNASASCAIEGLYLSKKVKKEIWFLFLTGLSSDECVEIFKKNRGM